MVVQGVVGEVLGKKLTAVVFAVVIDHKHNLPLKDVVIVDKAAGNSRDVLASLHLLQLPAEKGSRRGA